MPRMIRIANEERPAMLYGILKEEWQPAAEERGAQ